MVIPVGWKEYKIRECAKIGTGSKNTEDRCDNGRYPFFVRSQQIEHTNTYNYDCEAVLTAGDGVGTGKVFHYIRGRKFAVHQRVYVMSDFHNIMGKYFYYYFSKYFYVEVTKYTAKSSVDSVRRNMIADMVLIVPESEIEQANIVTVLSDTDELIASLEKMLVKKQSIKQGTMQELLNGKKRLVGFSEEWKRTKLDDVLYSCTRTIPLKDIKVAEYVGTDNMCSNLGGIADNKIVLSYSNVREYKQQDILISNIRPYLKKAWFADRNGGCSNDVLVFRVKNEKKYSARFLFFMLTEEDFFKFVMDNAIGTKMPRGDKSVIKLYEFLIPCQIEEQCAIANLLSDMDDEISALQQKLAKYRQIKQGMMAELLTGRIRLREA